MECSDILGLIGAGLGLASVILALFVPAFVEYSRRPSLRVEWAEDANNPDPYWRITHVRVINEPLAGWRARVLLRNSASSCRVSMEFRSRSDGEALPARGKWSAQPEPLAIIAHGDMVGRTFDAEKIPQLLSFDLPAGAQGETVAVAIKHNNDPHAYAFDPEIYANNNLRNDSFLLEDELYEVTVVAQAGEIKSEPRRFLLHNGGTSPRDLRLEATMGPHYGF